jgi:hypothetical protein
MMKHSPRTSPLLARAARAAERESDRMAAALAGYRRRHLLSEAGLAARLGCSLLQLHGLALCRRPAVAAEVAALAAYIGCDAERLAALLDEVTAPPEQDREQRA